MRADGILTQPPSCDVDADVGRVSCCMILRFSLTYHPARGQDPLSLSLGAKSTAAKG